MNVSELRVGNWVSNIHGIPMIVKAIYEDTVYVDFKGNVGGLWEFNKYEPFEPIPLTEEILLKCGFNYESKLSDKDCMVYYLHDELGILWAGYLCLDINGSFIPLADTELNHLHQLQNLYFALTGKEIEIEL